MSGRANGCGAVAAADSYLTGLVTQGALAHPEMARTVGHDVPPRMMLTFGGGTALA